MPSVNAVDWLKKTGVVDSPHELYKTKNDVNSYEARIDFLKDEAAIEGISLRRASESDFANFMSPAFHPVCPRNASLILTDSGEIRASWQDDRGSRIGLRF